MTKTTWALLGAVVLTIGSASAGFSTTNQTVLTTYDAEPGHVFECTNPSVANYDTAEKPSVGFLVTKSTFRYTECEAIDDILHICVNGGVTCVEAHARTSAGLCTLEAEPDDINYICYSFSGSAFGYDPLQATVQVEVIDGYSGINVRDYCMTSVLASTCTAAAGIFGIDLTGDPTIDEPSDFEYCTTAHGTIIPAVGSIATDTAQGCS